MHFKCYSNLASIVGMGYINFDPPLQKKGALLPIIFILVVVRVYYTEAEDGN